MLCSIYRWKISRASDSGKPLSGRAKRHLRRCADCRQFSRLSTELEARLTGDAAVLLKNGHISLSEKVLLSLDRNNKPVSLPRRISVKPVWAAATVSAIVLVAVVLASRVWLVSPRTEEMPGLESLFKYDPPGVYIKKAVLEAESPYAQEIQELKKALGATAGVIEASFSIGLSGEAE